MTYDIATALHDLTETYSEEETQAFLKRAAALIEPHPALYSLTFMREFKTEKEPWISGFYIAAAGITFAALQVRSSFWRFVELCPEDAATAQRVKKEDGSMSDLMCSKCSRVISKLDGAFPLDAALPSKYDHNDFSIIVQESKMAWAEVTGHLQRRLDELPAVDPLDNVLGATAIQETLRKMVDEYSHGTVGFPVQ